MSKNDFVFNVGGLIRAEQGAKLHFDINSRPDFEVDTDHPFTSNIKAKLTLMRIKDGIHAFIKDFKTSVTFTCLKCLKEFDVEIALDKTERVFFFEEQKGESDQFDLFYVDKKSFTIDISNFLRQEIILHFPMIPVCSKSCKGLCPTCGKNLNDGACKCKPIDTDNKPLAILKDIYKN
jgi:uncharacterized protein